MSTIIFGNPDADIAFGNPPADVAFGVQGQQVPWTPATPTVPPEIFNPLMALANAARCFKCIPVGMQREVQIALLCVPASAPALLNDDGSYIRLDDGGKILIN